MSGKPPDEFDAFVSGASPLSDAYARESRPAPPLALDRAVLQAARGARPVRSPCLAPLSLAATVLLSITVLSTLVLKPRERRPAPVRMMPVHLYSEEAARRTPEAWLADIAALRRAGRYDEAAEAMRRLRLAYPRLILPSED